MIERILIKQLAKIRPGYPFRGRIPETPAGDALVVQMKNVSQQFEIEWDTCIQTQAAGRQPPEWLSLRPGDTLLAARAARGGRNYAALVDQRVNEQKLPALAAPYFFVLTPTHTGLLPEYLAWFLNQAPIQRHFDQIAEGSITRNLRKRVLEETPVALPPLDRQKTIVGLAETIKQEQCIVEKFIRNGEAMMTAIATELLTSSDSR